MAKKIWTEGGLNLLGFFSFLSFYIWRWAHSLQKAAVPGFPNLECASKWPYQVWYRLSGGGGDSGDGGGGGLMFYSHC